MTQWRKFKIERKEKWEESNSVFFEVDNGVLYYLSGGRFKSICFIKCVDRYPFNTWQVGDCLEIDVDKTRNYDDMHDFDDTSVVRKISSSAVVSSSSSSTGMTIGSTTITRQQSLAVARELDAMVEQSGGTKEYTAHIEVQDNKDKPIKFSLSSKRAN